MGAVHLVGPIRRASFVLVLAACSPPQTGPNSVPAVEAERSVRHGSGATCGEQRRCPAKAPYCVVAAASLRCATASEVQARKHDGTSAALRCTRPTDCLAGERCCTTPLSDGTHCAASCDRASNLTVCLDAADCAGEAATVCEPPSREDAPTLPAWLLVCAES